MDHEIIPAGLDDRRTVTAVVNRAEAATGLDQDAVGRDRRGYPVVDGVDHAADGLRAVAQRGGPAHDFDLAGGQRVDGYGVVIAERRDITGGEPVLLGAYAKTAQAADDRPAGAGGERRS